MYRSWPVPTRPAVSTPLAGLTTNQDFGGQLMDFRISRKPRERGFQPRDPAGHLAPPHDRFPSCTLVYRSGPLSLAGLLFLHEYDALGPVLLVHGLAFGFGLGLGPGPADPTLVDGSDEQ